MGYPHKKNRTYQWALEQMSSPHNSVTLGRLDRELLDEHLVLTAIRNGNGWLHSVPEELRTKEVCLEAICLHCKDVSPTSLDDVPKELMDFDFLMQVHAAHPEWSDAIWKRQRAGREDTPMSENDIAMLQTFVEKAPAKTEWMHFLMSYAIYNLTNRRM